MIYANGPIEDTHQGMDALLLRIEANVAEMRRLDPPRSRSSGIAVSSLELNGTFVAIGAGIPILLENQ